MDKMIGALSGFANYLVLNGLLTDEVAKEASKQAISNKSSFILYLIQQNLLTPIQIAQVASSYFGIPVFDLNAFDKALISNDLLSMSGLQKRQAFPLCKKGDFLYVAVIDPMLPVLNEIKFLTGLTIRLVLVEADKLTTKIEENLSSQLLAGLGDLNDEKLDDINIENDETEEQKNATPVQELSVDATPIVRFINKILLDAINSNTSDIHFEPYEGFYRIRYRQDGLLHKIASPPIKIANYLVSRIKVMSNLDISERRVPQDGRFKLILSRTRAIDFRVSTCPTLYGEKVVMRLLNTSQALESVEKLGMEPNQQKAFEEALEHSQGMILVSGPTGSGKTVSLYTALGILNTTEKNISTVEDPVEIPVLGINQVHVNIKTGLTFSAALRSFLRQDPDIIMVGEIRDLETAEIAVKAAQTGHLVLSTLHTNSATETILRLANMGVPAYNLASSLILIIAQRLVRRLCEHCKKVITLPEAVLLQEGFKKEEIATLKLYKAVGCELCFAGYKGRVGFFEVMPISSDLANLIMVGGNALDLAKQARKEGILSLRESALLKVKQGVTSLEEINRVFKG